MPQSQCCETYLLGSKQGGSVSGGWPEVVNQHTELEHTPKQTSTKRDHLQGFRIHSCLGGLSGVCSKDGGKFHLWKTYWFRGFKLRVLIIRPY